MCDRKGKSADVDGRSTAGAVYEIWLPSHVVPVLDALLRLHPNFGSWALQDGLQGAGLKALVDLEYGSQPNWAAQLELAVEAHLEDRENAGKGVL